MRKLTDVAIESIDYKISQWLYKNPHATKLPAHMEALLYQLERHHQANNNKRQPTNEAKYEKDAIEEHLQDYSARKHLEIALADYVETIHSDELNTWKIQYKLRECRREGVYGTIDGKHVKRFDCKCGFSKMCPHEGREEQRRVVAKYQPAFLKWWAMKPTHRIFSTVFTVPNVPLGGLAESQKQFFKDLKAWSEKFSNVKGYLVCMECPLSVHGDWNIHANVILLVDGPFNYDQAQQAWQARTWFDEIQRGNVEQMSQALEHCIKYALESIVEKSTRKGKAPALNKWPAECFIEWYKAQKGFRRTRSYGLLNRQSKEHLLTDDDTDSAFTDPEWIAEFKFFEGEGYLVSSLLADKSGKKYRRIADLFYDDDSLNFDNWHDPP